MVSRLKIGVAFCGVLALAIAALLALVISISSSAAAKLDCAQVIFIGARGSGEPFQVTKNRKLVLFHHGIGVPIDYMAGKLSDAVDAYGEEMRILPVIYDADSVDELVPSRKELVTMAAVGPGNAAALYYERHLKPYIASIDQGARQTVTEVRAVLSGCPDTEIVLAGYSQGAMAVHQAELRLEREGDEDSLSAIGGTLLLGDGDRVPHTDAKLIGGAPTGGEGVRVYLHGIKAEDVAEPETTAEICAPNDIVCDFDLRVGPGASSWYQAASYIHTNYEKPPQRVYLDRAVDWLAQEMGLEPH